MGILIKYFNLYENLDWECKLEELESLVDEKTKFLYMVDPSNPLGTVFNKQHKIDILKFCERHNNLPIVADETYSHLVYSGPSFVHFHELSETVPIFYICSFSKKWLSPGWRCGWLILFCQKGVFTEIKKGIQNLLKITLMSNTIVQSAMPALLLAEETFIN
jgi:tyrosine aminotransferase